MEGSGGERVAGTDHCGECLTGAGECLLSHISPHSGGSVLSFHCPVVDGALWAELLSRWATWSATRSYFQLYWLPGRGLNAAPVYTHSEPSERALFTFACVRSLSG